MVPVSQELLGLLARTYGPQTAFAMVQRLQHRQQQQQQHERLHHSPRSQDTRLPLVLVKRSPVAPPSPPASTSSSHSGGGGHLVMETPEVEEASPLSLVVRKDLHQHHRQQFQLQQQQREDEEIRGSHPEKPSQPGARRARSGSSPAFLACHVCGDRAPNHIHYGGIACFSCRAFFRRSVPKHNSYFCMADAACRITPSTRKNCQFCRYQGCLRAGMKASWVLSDKEKLERTAKKLENRAKRMRAMQKTKQEDMSSSGPGFQLHHHHHSQGPHPHFPFHHRLDPEQLQDSASGIHPHPLAFPARSASTGSSGGSVHSAGSPASSPPLPHPAYNRHHHQHSGASSSAAASAAYAMLMLQQQGRPQPKMEADPAPATDRPIKVEDGSASPMSAEEEDRIGSWLASQEATRQTVPMPSAIMSELIRMTTTGDVMGAENMVELFKTGYSRVAAFAKAVEEFAELKADTR